MRDSFVFYRSFADALKGLKNDEFRQAVETIFNYALDDKEPADGSGISNLVYSLIKPQIDANNRRYENGKKGGRTKQEPNENQTKTKPEPKRTKQEPNETKPEPNVNVNVNVNDNVNDNANVNDSPSGKKETQAQILNRLVADQNIGLEVENKIREWIAYKSERKETYKEVGMKALIAKIQKAVHEYGEIAVMDAIDQSMASGWKGLFFDKIKKPQTYIDAINNRFDPIADWAQKRREYDSRRVSEDSG